MTAKSAKVTRADVAKRAGISPTTVAYVLNETPGVKIREETRAKVLAAAKELGYNPSFSARSMRRGRTELVGILMPAMSSQFHPFYAQMLHGVYEAAAESDYHFLLLTQDRREKYERCLRQNYLDGVIVIQSADDAQHIRRVLEQGLPAVTLNALHDCAATQVTMDYEAAMDDAVSSLCEGGAESLLFIHGAWENQPMARYRKRFTALSRRKSHQSARFEQMGLNRYQLDPEQIAKILSAGWGGLIVDGYELARDIAFHSDYRQSAKPPRIVVFSETQQPAPLGNGVRILQSPAMAAGRLAWDLLSPQLAGAPFKRAEHRLPFQNLS